MYPFQSILVHWFLKCGCSLLPSPVWPLSICLDSWTWHSRFLCNIALYSIGLYFHHQSHPKCCFCFGSVSSFFLELFLCWSPKVYWAPTNLGSSSFSIISLCLFMQFMGFSRQEYWSGLPFSSSAYHVLSKLSTTIHPSWVALHGMAHSFIELDMHLEFIETADPETRI